MESMKSKECLTQLLGHLSTILVLQKELHPDHMLLYFDSVAVKFLNTLDSINILV